MATLTYDSTPADQPEFNEQEIEALKVGEQAAEEQNQMLAGKFKDAEALEQAYIELQKKLGEPNENESDEVRREEGLQEQRDEEEVTSSFLDTLWDESQSEYTQETLNALGEMDAKQIAQMYLEYRHQAETESSPEISPEVVTNLQNIAGGEESYNQMIDWAGQNLSREEITMFDNVIEQGDPSSCFFAIQALTNRYQDSVGKDGKVLTGYAPQDTADVFRSQAEVVAAMQDPRYDRDPAYRNDVFTKLNRSNINY